jgi:hypothetical protein
MSSSLEGEDGEKWLAAKLPDLGTASMASLSSQQCDSQIRLYVAVTTLPVFFKGLMQEMSGSVAAL